MIYSLSSHVQDGTQAEGFLCYQEKCQTEICCPAKSEIYKKKRQVPQKEENDDRFKILRENPEVVKQNIKISSGSQTSVSR